MILKECNAAQQTKCDRSDVARTTCDIYNKVWLRKRRGSGKKLASTCLHAHTWYISNEFVYFPWTHTNDIRVYTYQISYGLMVCVNSDG